MCNTARGASDANSSRTTKRFMVLREKQSVAQEMRLSYALQLFKSAKITLSKAAQLAGLNHYEFIDACKKEYP